MKYWVGDEYLGFGPCAASDFAGRRFTIKPDLEGYIKGVMDKGQILSESELVPLRERAGEYLMLRLRTVDGIEKGEYTRSFLLPFSLSALADYISADRSAMMRELKKMREEMLVTISGRQVTLP